MNFYKDSKEHQYYSLHVPHITVQFQAASGCPTNFPPPFLLHNHLGIHYWTAQVFNALISAFRNIFFTVRKPNYQQGLNNESLESAEMLRFLLCSRRKNKGNNKILTCNSVNFAMKLRFLLMSICVGEWSSTSLSFCSWPGRKQQSSEITTKQAQSYKGERAHRLLTLPGALLQQIIQLQQHLKGLCKDSDTMVEPNEHTEYQLPISMK